MKEIFKLFAEMKHKTGTNRQNILDWAVNIQDCLTNGYDFKEMYGIEMIEATNEIIKNVSDLTKEIETLERKLQK